MPLGIDPMPFGIIRESQGDSAPKPRVASRELPWEKAGGRSTPTIVVRWRKGAQPRWGWKSRGRYPRVASRTRQSWAGGHNPFGIAEPLIHQCTFRPRVNL